MFDTSIRVQIPFEDVIYMLDTVMIVGESGHPDKVKNAALVQFGYDYYIVEGEQELPETDITIRGPSIQSIESFVEVLRATYTDK